MKKKYKGVDLTGFFNGEHSEESFIAEFNSIDAQLFIWPEVKENRVEFLKKAYAELTK